MPDYLLDTNAFNRSLDLNIDPSTITRRGAVFVTHIQVNELSATRRTDRQLALLEILQKIDPSKGADLRGGLEPVRVGWRRVGRRERAVSTTAGCIEREERRQE
jgi:hypothetical protein